MYKKEYSIAIVVTMILSFLFTIYIFIPIYNNVLSVREPIKDITIHKENFIHSSLIHTKRPIRDFTEIEVLKKVELTTKSDASFVFYEKEEQALALKDKKEIEYMATKKTKIFIIMSIMLLFFLCIFSLGKQSVLKNGLLISSTTFLGTSMVLISILVNSNVSIMAIY